MSEAKRKEVKKTEPMEPGSQPLAIQDGWHVGENPIHENSKRASHGELGPKRRLKAREVDTIGVNIGHGSLVLFNNGEKERLKGTEISVVGT